ncbi:histidine phosphatase family protein [Primorskyibacter sp. S187A]|uniref:histidine phosphatase family protein n=1 Tax=Primorskyibacter sp. S187A TaxID=3415130 RepID=UPI003C7ECFAB
MALTFVRHTTPEVAKGVCYGRTDLDLATTFAAEVKAVRAALGNRQQIFTSPLKRCVQLSGMLGNYEILDAVVEMDFGRWEMTPWDEIPRQELDQWADDFFDAKPHGGESVAELRDRVADALRVLPDGAVVVTHAGIIKAVAALTGHPEGWDIKPAFGAVLTFPSAG